MPKINAVTSVGRQDTTPSPNRINSPSSATYREINRPSPYGLGYMPGQLQKTHSDLRRDTVYQEQAEKFLTWLGENQGTWERVTGGLRNKDIFETLRDEEGRLGTAIDRANIMRDAPEDIKETYIYLRKEFEESSAGSFNEIAKAAFDRGVDMFADPINLLFALVAPGVGSAAASKAAPSVTAQLIKKSGEQSATRTLRNIASTNAAKAGAFEGAVWTGAENIARQDKDISLGLQDAFSGGEFGLSTLSGTALGGGFGYGLSRFFNGTPSRADDIVSDNINTTPRRLSFDDPDTPRPTALEYQRIENGKIVTKEAKIVYGPLIEPDGQPRTREDGSRVNASRRVDKDGNVTVRLDIDAIKASFNQEKKPWTRDDITIDGRKIIPLKANDIRTEEEWIMFNLFHEMDHASFIKPKDMPQAIYENSANVAALRELKKWRANTSTPSSPTTSTNPRAGQIVDESLNSAFNKALMRVNAITGDEYYDRLANPTIDNTLLRSLTTGEVKKLDPVTNRIETSPIDIMLPEKDAANIIYAIKDILLKDSNVAVRSGDLDISAVQPEIAEAIRKYNLSSDQIKTILDEVTETYVTPPVRTTRDGKTVIETQILGDDEIKELASTLSTQVGGGTTTSDILTDEIKSEALKAGRLATPLDVKRNIRTKVVDFVDQYLATSVGGFTKATNILNPAKRYGFNVIDRLQRNFTSELGQSWNKNKVQVRDVNDFSTYYNEVFGTSTSPIRIAYDELRAGGVKGKDLKEVNKIIATAVRTNNRNLNKIEFPTKVSKELVVNAADAIRKSLREIGQEAKAKGLLENTIEDYLPRLWNREAIEKNREQFKQLLISKKGIAGLTDPDEADEFIEQLLDIKYQFGNEHRFGGNSFFANRKIDLINEDAFADFVETDLSIITNSYFSAASKAIAKKDILGVRNLEEFNKIWGSAIEKEMKANGADGALIQKAKKDASYLYQNVTGEQMDRFGKTGSFLTDGYMLANRMAYLPLATISSLTEIFINMSKAGVGTSFRGFRDAVMNGSQKMYYDSMDNLQKVHGLTRAEARRELNSLGIALEQAMSDSVERLSGDELSNRTMRQISNGFFRFTLLDQWTKTVQLTSYITGKRLITENIENLANKIDLINSGQISNRMQRQINELADLGINYNDGIRWYNDGASLTDDFYDQIKRGGGVYTNEVILNPSAQSGLKPTYMSNPKTAVFGQLLGYPAAFTNTIMKNVAKDIARNPETMFTKHLPTVAIMTGTASLLNGIRTNGEAFEDKDAFDIAAEGLVRTGANGLLADQIKRGRDAMRYYQSPEAFITGAGVVPGDLYKLARQGDILSFFFNKIPGTGARNLILNLFDEDLPDKVQRKVKEADKDLTEALVPERLREPRGGLYKGGEVYDVPQVNPEPDERVDRMTGMPYDIQAGEAFVDEEDRDIRSTFNEGGIFKKIFNKALTAGAEALGFGAEQQRAHEKEVVSLVNQFAKQGLIPERSMIPTDEAGFGKFGAGADEEAFNAFNHAYLVYKHGSTLKDPLLQAKEIGQSFFRENPNTEKLDMVNNAYGANLRDRAENEEDAKAKLALAYYNTSKKLAEGKPLIYGEDLVFNVNDLDKVESGSFAYNLR